MSVEENSAWGPLSALVDVTDTAETIIGVLQNLFTDHEPRDEDGQRTVFVVGASIHRGMSGDDEVDQAVRERYLGVADRPRASWEAEVSHDAIVRMAQDLVDSRSRPDTQLVGPSRLEMMVRDETPHSTLLPPAGGRVVHRVPTSGGEFTVTVGPPSPALLMRCALRVPNKVVRRVAR